MAEHIVMAAANEPLHEHIVAVQMYCCDLFVVQTTWFWSLNLLLSSINYPYYNVCHKYCYDIKCRSIYPGVISVSLAVQVFTCL